MARWSEPFRFDAYKKMRAELAASGCYEFGIMRGKRFVRRYIGKSHTIFGRLKKYANPKECHNREVARRLHDVHRPVLWVRVIRTASYDALEHRLLRRLGHGPGNGYPWNRKHEPGP